jgi:hypothetical protein
VQWALNYRMRRLYSVMEPGDEIMAGAEARTGPSLLLDLTIVLMGIGAAIAAFWLSLSGKDVPGVGTLAFFLNAVTLAQLFVRK